ncbi:MAG TPA: hypothetical protein QGF05_03760 [Dehalococcoidia bacterium]|nr:hypothetical protein [Dehalococcoidia bacterium]
MARYIIRFQANPAAWPIDPAQTLALWEGVVTAGTVAIEDGTFSDVVWTSGISGYAVVDAESKDGAIAATSPFFPLFTQSIEEGVSWTEATTAILAGARAAAGQ